MRYRIMFLNVGSLLNFSVVGARTLLSAKTSGLCIRQLMTKIWMDIMRTGPTALNASMNKSSTQGSKFMAFNILRTSFASGGSMSSLSLLSTLRSGSTIGSTNFKHQHSTHSRLLQFQVH